MRTLRTRDAGNRRHLLLAGFVSVVVIAAVGFSAAGGGASVQKPLAKAAFGATYANGKYGENYNPSPAVVNLVLGTPAALPTNAIQRNIALASLARAEKSKKDNEDLAYKCWKQNICSTGTGGKITVGEADGFGGNPARQLFKMQFILQALTYPQIGKIIYTDANLNTQKAISDVRSMIAQGVNAIVSYPDAANALLPAYRAATQRHIPIALWSNANIGKPGADYLTYTGNDICTLGKSFAAILNKGLPKGGEVALLGGTPGNTQSPAWQKCEKAALNKNIKVVATQDTGWTTQGALQAMSGILAKNPNIKGVSYDYGAAFVGAIRAFQAANVSLDGVVATLYSNDSPLLCEYKKLNNPKFKAWASVGTLFQGTTALTAVMMKLAGAPVPAQIIYNPNMVPVTTKDCTASIPANGSPTLVVSPALQKRMFG